MLSRRGVTAALVLLLSAVPAAPAFAQPSADPESWVLCRTPATQPARDSSLPRDTEIEFTSDKAVMERQDASILTGNVEVRRGTQELDADRVHYTQREDRVTAEGNVRLYDRGLTVTGPRTELLLDSDEFEFIDARYHYSPLHARGEAASMHREPMGLVTLREAVYTTCDPGDDFWRLSAGTVDLDRESGVGEAWNVVLRLSDVPLFYTPYISFPIDDRRKSGFLTPTAGTSSDSGFELATPYYWNIAPHRDATFTPRLLTERGLQLLSEFRYLNPSNDGQLALEYLDDREFDDERYLIGFEHDHRLLPGLSADLLYAQVSDEDYFDDLGNSLSISSITHLQRYARLNYSTGPWRAFIRAQDYQTIDEAIPDASRPYERLPQIVLEGEFYNQAGFDYGLDSEWVRFRHDDRVTAERLNLEFELARPFLAPSAFFIPAAEMHYTDYQLDNIEPGDKDDLSRSVPSFSLDTGLIFEREAFGGDFLQTLEPRLFYLYTPFREQNDIPRFDTSLLDFTFSQLFRTDRFSGPDRVGDANQLTAALTSRLLSREDGQEILSASAGQIRYFDDREVGLQEEDFQDDDRSDLAGELSLHLGANWQARWSVLWDPSDSRTQRSAAQIGYRASNNRIVNLSYRQRRDPRGLPDETLEQADLAFAWPLTPRWRILGRYNYDIENDQDLEILAGIEYESCCWALRLVGRRYLNDFDRLSGFGGSGDADYRQSIQVQLVLKGLTRLGSPLGELLERGILGYEDY